jgi:hypothetical protein
MCKPTLKLTDAIGQENAENLIGMIERAQGRAIDRHAEQEVAILFNKVGAVHLIRGSDTVNGVKQPRYTPE